MRAIILIYLCFLTFFCQAKPPLALALSYEEGVDVSAYWVSEKYDGVRAYWDGKRLLTRAGEPIEAPDFFTAGLPSFALDGELWFGRGEFARASALVKRSPSAPDYEAQWRSVRYMLFDAPDTAGNFPARLARLGSFHGAQVQVAPQWSVKTHGELLDELHKISAKGAEGLMLRRIEGRYRAGRSDDLLKVKLWQDAEATVIGHLEGKGKYQGQLGALLVRLDDGRQVRVGTGFSDAERATPPAIGSRITYKYQGLTSTGLPRFPVYWRLRPQ